MRILITIIFLLAQVTYAADGELQVYSFRGATPLNGQKILINGKSYTADQEGRVILKLPAGEHQITLNEGETVKNFEIYIGDDQVSQMLFDFKLGLSGLKVEKFQPQRTVIPVEGKGLTVAGKITNDKGQVVYNARVYVKGQAIEAITDKNGIFSFIVPSGQYVLTIIHPQYSTLNTAPIVVDHEVKNLNFEVVPSGLELSEMKVSAPHIKGSSSALTELRRNSSQVNDVMGAEQISKSGDSDAAGSLKRVTGLTLVDGKFVYVRGLGERYSSTLLNEASIPGPDPSRKVIPLDMFPSSILEGLIVQKSYSVDMPAEFGGGVVKLQTKTVPEKFFMKVELGSSFNDGENQQMTYQGGRTDWLGIDDGTRALPQSVREATANNKKLAENNIVFKDGYTAEELAQFGRDMPNIYATEQSNQSPPPSFSTATGDRFLVGSMKLGYLLGSMYSNSWDSSSKIKRKYVVESGDTLKMERDFLVESSENTVKLGGMLNLGAIINSEHEISANVFVLRNTTNESEIKSGFHTDLDEIRETSLEWTERQLLAYQLQGRHTFNSVSKLNMKWRGSLATATMDRPDSREYRYEKEGEVLKFSTRNDGNQRIYAELEDITKSGAVDFSLPINWYTKDPLKLMAGGLLLERDRESKVRRFTFVDKGLVDPTGTLRERPLEDILSAENIKPTGYQLQENTLATDNYTANQEISAAYGAIEIPIIERLSFGVGMRYERSVQYVKTFELFNPDNNPAIASLETIDYLPAYQLTTKWTDSIISRAAYSETVSRPDFKELSTATYTDDERGVDVVGNENLESTVIRSIDLRTEWYGVGKDVFSIGVFQKNFERPIESIIRPGTEGKLSFDNALSAQNRGLELEFIKSLRFISRRVEPLSLGGNFSWIKSEITLDPTKSGVLTNENRPLQGQSPYVYNVNLDYDNKDTGTIVTLLYNIFGERISDVGTGGAPDIVEQPFQQLDLVASQKLSKSFSFKFKLKNLIDPEAKRTQGIEVTELYRKGREASVALSGSF